MKTRDTNYKSTNISNTLKVIFTNNCPFKQELGHSSVVTTEIYAKFSLRRLEADFPSLVKSTNISNIGQMGHNYKGHTSTGVSASPIISGLRTS